MRGFDCIAAYYEVLSDSESRLRREGPFLKERLDQAPGMRVVDLACGTGLHARFFADLGAQVSAIDLSPEMIRFAREHRGHPAIRYAVGDMRALRGGPWDLAVCLGNSLSLLGFRKAVDTALEAVSSSLAPGGLFVVQVLNYAAAAAQRPRHRVERKTRGDAEIIAVKNLVPHGDRTLLSVTFHTIRNGEHESVTDTAVLLHLDQEAILESAALAALEVYSVYGGFDGSAYQPGLSSDLVVILRKPCEMSRA